MEMITVRCEILDKKYFVLNNFVYVMNKQRGHKLNLKCQLGKTLKCPGTASAEALMQDGKIHGLINGLARSDHNHFADATEVRNLMLKQSLTLHANLHYMSFEEIFRQEQERLSGTTLGFDDVRLLMQRSRRFDVMKKKRKRRRPQPHELIQNLLTGNVMSAPSVENPTLCQKRLSKFPGSLVPEYDSVDEDDSSEIPIRMPETPILDDFFELAKSIKLELLDPSDIVQQEMLVGQNELADNYDALHGDAQINSTKEPSKQSDGKLPSEIRQQSHKPEDLMNSKCKRLAT